MRKFTTLCCFAAVLSMSILSCQKSESDLIPVQPTTPSVPTRVVEFANQKLDYQHLTTIQNPNDTAQTSPTLNNNARFALTYFHLFEGEKERVYTLTNFKSALIEAGLSEKNAQLRTFRIFNSTNCSPAYLTETGQLLSLTLPPHVEGAFICELYKPYDASQVETLLERRMRNNEIKVLYKKTNLTEHIKDVHKLVGVSGSVVGHGNSRIELIYDAKSSASPTSLRLEPQEVRLLLQSKRGYTEGEAIYLKLILGGLTEQEVWQLFETDIFPELQKANRINARKSDNELFSRLFFRYNYVEITGNTGRLGYTVYDLEGFKDEKTAN